MDLPDKTWMTLLRNDPKYIEGVALFIEYALRTTGNELIACPCVKCANRYYENRELVRNHLIVYGIRQNYDFWYYHGEKRVTNPPPETNSVSEDEDDDLDDEDDELEDEDDESEDVLPDEEIGVQQRNVEEHPEPVHADQYMEDIIHDLYPNEGGATVEGIERPVQEARAFYKLLDDSKLPLYEQARISKASALLKLLHLKSVGQWTNTSFDLLLKLLHEEILPVNSQLPTSYYECKKFITDIGLSYENIDACKNDCMLFRKEDKDLQNCKVCGLSRWKINPTSGAVRKKVNGKSIPNKVLRYFPLAPRLQRLFMCSKTAPQMTWHKNNNPNDGVLRHPSNSLTWTAFDDHFTDFSSEPRNVRLSLASDGFQPFANGKTSYSIWPVILIPYNVPPTVCMDTSNFIMSMLIPGPKSPGDSIDVFLQPLIEELKELWHTGVVTYDASRSQYFNLRAALLWTINDFPAYANLSGWSTKGKLACPSCNKDTASLRLTNWQKECYMSHRRFLPPNHRWRRDRDSFDGQTEFREAPDLLTGTELLLQARDLQGICLTKYGPKKTKICHESRGDNWNKLSIFFKLPYWRWLLQRHNLDVMHIEKNICDSVLGTLMDLKGKTKDGLRARQDLASLNIRHSLHPVEVNGILHCPTAPYSLSSEKKKRLCQFLKDVRMPEGFCSNIGGCVNVNEKKISGLKSHDCHILLQYLIPLATRGLLPEDVYDALVGLSRFFQLLCRKSFQREDLDALQDHIVLTLCKLEKIFPPSFFDIMVHLPVHLTFEALLGGPVQYRWMYPVEQYMGTLKKFLRNRNFPEGSISETYLVNESMSLCGRYLEDQVPLDANTTRTGTTLSIFSGFEDLSNGTPYTYETGDRERAHAYILKNCFEAEQYFNEFMDEINATGQSIPFHEERDRRYITYFRARVEQLIDDSDTTMDLKILGAGPTIYAKKYNSCKINGYKFNTEKHDECLTTQNSGVVVLGNNGAETINYYGVLTDILEVQFFNGKRVILFKCRWFDVNSKDRGVKVDKYGYVSINMNRTLRTQIHEPFIMATQAEHVFYSTDMASRPGWKIVTKINPRYSSYYG